MRRRLLPILACFFASGAAGLVYQVAWSKALGLIFGHTVYAVAVVLAVFMAGLAAGSAYFGSRAQRYNDSLQAYAWLEFMVGAGGALSLVGLLAVRWLYVWTYPGFGEWRSLLLAVRLLGAALVLFIPTFLMGGTLPVLVRGVSRDSPELGVRVSQLYWVNTAGAVLGALISGFVLLPVLGLRLTIAFAVALNVLAGLVVLRRPKIEQMIQTRLSEEKPALTSKGSKGSKSRPKTGERKAGLNRVASDPMPPQIGSKALLLVFALVGCTAFVFEIAWTRLLSIAIGSSTYAFTLMLAAFLAGSVIGSAVFQRYCAGRRISYLALARSQLAIGASALGSLAAFHWIPALIPPLLDATGQRFSGLILTQFVVSALTVFPAAIFFGFNFPLVVLLFHRSASENEAQSKSVGQAYAANTIGAIVGAIVTGFWLIPLLGPFRAIVAAAAINLLLSLVLNLVRRPRRLIPVGVDVLCILAALTMGRSAFFNNQSLLSLSAVLYGDSHQGRLTLQEIAATFDLVFAADGVNDSISVLRTDDTAVLRVNGKVDASTGDAPTQLLLAHLGAVFHPAPRRVLIIGFGSGMTAYAMSLYPDVERIDCVEIEPAVIRAAPYLESLNHNVLRDPRVHIVLDDARNFLLTAKGNYDLIISEPSNPWIAGVATLFTREYYAAARRKLAPGGIFVQWVQAYSLDPSDLRMIMAGFAPHFPEVTLWRGQNPDLLLVGRTDPKPFQFDRLRSLWRNPALRKTFEDIDILQPEGLAAYYLLDDSAIRKLAASGALNTDDLTRLEYDAPRSLLRRGLSDVNQELIRQFRTGPLPRNLVASAVQPALEAGLQTALDIKDDLNAAAFLAALETASPPAAAYIGQGRLALDQGDLTKAKAALETAFKLDPSSSPAMHWLAVADHRAGDDAAATALVDQVIATHPDFKPALEDRMLFAVDRKDFHAAVTAQLDRMAQMTNPPAYEYCRLGAAWIRIPNYTVAEPALLKGLQKDPYSYACHLELGEVYRKTNRLDRARQNFEWVVRFFPDADPSIFRSLAGIYVALGDPASARSILKKGRRIFPGDAEIEKAEQSANE